MSFYKIPAIGQNLKWCPREPRTVVRFDREGLVVLHASANPLLTTSAWLTQPVEVALYGLDPSPASGEVPPVLCARVGNSPYMAAPICLLELADPGAIYQWLNTRPTQPQLRLLLLRLDPLRAQATVETSRRIWAAEWLKLDASLRQRLEQQILNTEDEAAGDVQAAGRELVARQAASDFFTKAACHLSEAGQLLTLN